MEDGIETAIEQLKARKAALADAPFAGSTKTALDLTEADISALFAPLDRRRSAKRGELPAAARMARDGLGDGFGVGGDQEMRGVLDDLVGGACDV